MVIYISRSGETPAARKSGCGEVWYRAWMGFKRPWVRISALGPKQKATAKAVAFCFCFQHPKCPPCGPVRWFCLCMSILWLAFQNIGFLPSTVPLNSNSLSAWSKRVEWSNLSIARREHRYRCSRLVRWDLSPSSISPLIILQLAVPPSSQPHRLHLPVTGPLRCASIRNTPKFHKYLQIMIPCPQLHPNQTLPQNL